MKILTKIKNTVNNVLQAFKSCDTVNKLSEINNSLIKTNLSGDWKSINSDFSNALKKFKDNNNVNKK